MATAAFLALLIMTTGCVREFHVAPHGVDTAAGTADAPFATLTQARDAARLARADSGLPSGGVIVWAHGGIYEFEESLALGQ